MLRTRLVAAMLAAVCAASAAERTILAIGAHAGDMEIAAGAVLARHVRLGDRVVLLHLTLGEGGNPKLTRPAYAEQKRREAAAAAKVLGAEVIIGPYEDAQIPRSSEPAAYVADIIAKVKPTHILTHWKNSIHRDHSLTYTIVDDAVLLASVRGNRGLRGIWFTDNWEDAEGFQPYVYIDVSEDLSQWKRAVTQYEFIRGGISNFPYLDYYEAMARVRGAQSGYKYAVAFDIDALGKKRVLTTLP